MPRPDFETRRQQMLRSCANKPHGTRQRYVSGCRCMLCRAANSRYETERAAARRNGNWNGLVDATPAREHLRALSALGIGRHSVNAACDVSDMVLWTIMSGERKRIRARTEKRILAVDAGALPGNAKVDARPAWRLLDELIGRGFSKAQLAKWMGYKVGAIQLNRRHISFRNHLRVERLYRAVEAGRLRRN